MMTGKGGEVDVAILCPGPSLARLVTTPPGVIVLAINHAMSHPAANLADWWVALDLWVWELPAYRPLEGMVTSSAAIEEGQARRVPYHLVNYRQHPLSRGTGTTLPAALWWAVHLGAKRARLYGCDWAGDADFRGIIDGSDRSAERWVKEASECQQVTELTGLQVERQPC